MFVRSRRRCRFDARFDVHFDARFVSVVFKQNSTSVNEFKGAEISTLIFYSNKN